MKKILSIFITLLCAIQFSSCEDFLDQRPSNSIPEDEIVVRTKAEAQVLMNGIMRAMSSGSYYGRDMMLYADAKGGDLAIRANGRGYDGLYKFSHSASTGSQSGFWTQIYYCLLQVNTILEVINQSEESGTVIDDLSLFKGQALTLRALMHFDLVRLYGKPYTSPNGPNTLGVPIVKTVKDVYEKPLRSTVEEVYQQVLKDLADGEIFLDNTEGKKRSYGYINYYGNRAVQARVNLFMGNYDAALSHAEEVINNGPYTLFSNAEWPLSWAKEFQTESIFEIGMYQDENDLGTASLGAMYIRRNDPDIPTGRGYFYASTPFLTKLDEGYDSSAAKPEETKDIRWSVMARDETSASRLGACLKYVGGVEKNGDKGFSGRYSAANVKVIRLSEMYLIAAEAALFSTNPPADPNQAAVYLNKIRSRSPNLAPATDITITLDMVLDERSKELFTEGHRYFDMMRLNRPITFDDGFVTGGVAASLRPKTIDGAFYKTILPIPKIEIDTNPKIGDQQNPGY